MYHIKIITPLCITCITMAKKVGVKIQIRCSAETRDGFKKLATNFGDYEDAIKAFIVKYNSSPQLFHIGVL